MSDMEMRRSPNDSFLMSNAMNNTSRCQNTPCHTVSLFAFTFSAMETPSRVQISSVNERGRTVPEHALMNEPGQTSGAATVQHSGMLALT